MAGFKPKKTKLERHPNWLLPFIERREIPTRKCRELKTPKYKHSPEEEREAEEVVDEKEKEKEALPSEEAEVWVKTHTCEALPFAAGRAKFAYDGTLLSKAIAFWSYSPHQNKLNRQ